jgi:hypothetical protein
MLLKLLLEETHAAKFNSDSVDPEISPGSQDSNPSVRMMHVNRGLFL